MSVDPAVRLEAVEKRYRRGATGPRWRAALPFDLSPEGDLLAVDGLSLTIEAGETVGLIGPNGAGKSTVLKLVAGVTDPSAGSVEVRGSLGSMIELGVGFHPDLTGRENAWSGLIMAGLSGAEAEEAMAGVAQFAGLAAAMDRPLKQYSLGMQARLAFSIATHRRVDVLVIDEVLAVGDADFQLRCIDRIGELVAGGTAVLFVTHEMPLVTHVCERAVHLRQGRIVDDGPARQVVERYLSRASSTFVPASGRGAVLGPLEMSDSIPPWGRIEVEVDVDVERTLTEPRLGVDLSLPTVAPDLVSASSIVDVPALARPGRYRLRGLSNPIGFGSAFLRATVTVVDGVEALASAQRDVVLTGPHLSARPEVAVEVEARMIEGAEGPPPGLAPRRRSSAVDGDPMVVVRGATKRYRAGGQRGRARGALPGRYGVDRHGDITALDDLHLAVERGETVGVIGPNGSGKSTLLRAVAGLVRLDAGTISVEGRVTPVLGISSGLHPALTGRENLGLLSQLLGAPLTPASQAWAIEFAGLGEALDVPLREYSSGMVARLTFAASLAQQSDVLLLDELLAVGDEDFRRAAIDEVSDRSRAGATVLFVSHELRLVEHLCARVVRLEGGRLVDDGPASEVIDAYGHIGGAAGVRDATSGIRLRDLTLSQRHITSRGEVAVEGTIVVDLPSDTVRLELTYLAMTDAPIESLSMQDRERMRLLRRTIEPAGGVLSRTGVHRFSIRVSDHGFAGRVYVVVSVVDDLDESIGAEVWRELQVGEDRPEGFPGPVLTFGWEAEAMSSGTGSGA